MQTALLISACLAGAPAQHLADVDVHRVTAGAIAPQLRTGALIFSAGDCLAVKVFTTSPYTHVAAVVVDAGGDVTVYDSTAGAGVRRLPLAEYLAAQSPAVIHIHQPRQALTKEAELEFAAYLESQVGRPYSILHHLSGKRCSGLHCSEYVMDALMSIDLMQAQSPPRVSPASLREGILTHCVYTAGESISLERRVPQPAASNGCHRLWLSTVSCCRDCCSKLSGWILCR